MTYIYKLESGERFTLGACYDIAINALVNEVDVSYEIVCGYLGK